MPEQILTRTCYKCKVPQPFPSNFHRDRHHPSGYRSICKTCNRKYNQTPQRKKYFSEYDKTPKAKLCHRRWHETENGKTSHRDCFNRCYRDPKNVLKNKARFAVTNALRWNKRQQRLVRPSSCSKCGITCKPESHHHMGYDPENWLNVIWLCKPCHDFVEHQRD